MHAIFDSHYSTINRLSNFVVNFVLYDLVFTCTIFTINDPLSNIVTEFSLRF